MGRQSVWREISRRLTLTWMTVFDNGHLRQNPEKARQMMDRLLSTMRGNEETSLPKPSLVEVHDSVWQRIAKVCGLSSLNFPLIADSLSRRPPSVSVICLPRNL